MNAETSEWIVYPLDTFQYLGWHNVGGDAPETFIGTSQGDIDSLRVGAALNFLLYGYPTVDYFNYRLVYYENTGTDTLHIGPIGAIIDSTGQYEIYVKTDFSFIRVVGVVATDDVTWECFLAKAD